MATYHVTLDGQGYMLDLPSYRKSVGSQVAPKTRDGDLGYSDFTALSIWAQENWQGGAGFETYEANPGNRYNSGVFIDSSFGDLRVGPSMASVHAPASVTDLWRFATYADKVYVWRGDSGSAIYESTDGITWSSVHAPGPPPAGWRGGGTFNNLLLVGSASNGDVHKNDAGTWALWGTVAGSPTSIDAIKEFWRVYASRLVYLGVRKSNGRASLYSANTTPTFTEVAETPYGRIEALEVWNDTLWIGAISDSLWPRGALYTYDLTNFELIAEIPENAIASFAVFQGRLYAASATHGKVWEVSLQGLTEIFQIPDVIGIGGTNAYAQDIRQMVVHNERLYIPITDADGIGVYQFDGTGWAKTSTGGIGQESRGLTSHNTALLASTKNSGGARVYRIAAMAATSATFISGWFDADLAGIEKAFVRLTVRHAALAANESVVVDYALDDSGSFTNLGTSDTDGAVEKTFSFAAATKGKKIRLRLTLNLVTTTATPKVRSTIMEYQVAPDVKAEWQFDTLLEGTTELPLILKDQDVSPLSGAALSDALWTSKAKKQTLSFTDIDGEAKTVLFQDLEERVMPRSERLGLSTIGRVKLLEA